MNERIKEMITELGMFHDSELYEIAEAVLQKCIEQIQAQSMGSGDEWEKGLRIAESAIKEHFGLK